MSPRRAKPRCRSSGPRTRTATVIATPRSLTARRPVMAAGPAAGAATSGRRRTRCRRGRRRRRSAAAVPARAGQRSAPRTPAAARYPATAPSSHVRPAHPASTPRTAGIPANTQPPTTNAAVSSPHPRRSRRSGEVRGPATGTGTSGDSRVVSSRTRASSEGDPGQDEADEQQHEVAGLRAVADHERAPRRPRASASPAPSRPPGSCSGPAVERRAPAEVEVARRRQHRGRSRTRPSSWRVAWSSTVRQAPRRWSARVGAATAWRPAARRPAGTARWTSSRTRCSPRVIGRLGSTARSAAVRPRPRHRRSPSTRVG